jgi:stage IV sporulation protein FB
VRDGASTAKAAALRVARMKADMNGERTRMKWSLRLGQLAGTVVYVHVTFFVLLAWIGVASGLEKGSLAAAAEAVAFTTTLFACVVLHEFGHAFMARRFGIRTRDIVLFPFGGVGRLERIPEVPSQEFLIALAGPAVSVGIATALFAVLQLQDPLPSSRSSRLETCRSPNG